MLPNPPTPPTPDRAKPRSALGRLLVSALLMASCTDTAASPAEADAAAGADAVAEESGVLFETHTLLKVDIEMAEDDWDAVRWQTRPLDGFLAPNCGKQPFGSPFTYRPATVTVNGVKMANVGVRKKGFVGSISSFKPSLKIKFDKYVKGQELLGLERLTLNNNKSDPALVRQCLVYYTFAQAGVPAPRCSFAHVTVNGRSLGVYTLLDSIKRRFIARHFKNADGSLYEGTMSDFAQGWTDTFEPKTSATDPTLGAVTDLQQALALGEGEALPAIASLVDLEAFYTFWAVETLVGHGDGYNGNRNNFYVYVPDGGGPMHFIPWGADMTLSAAGKGGKGGAGGSAAIHPIIGSALSQRLYGLPKSRAALVQATQQMLEKGWQEAELQARITSWEKLVAPALAADHFAKDIDLKAEMDALRAVVAGRRAAMVAGLESLPAESYITKGGGSSPLCNKVYGTASGAFSTTLGTLGAVDPFAAGAGAFTATLDGKPFTAQQVGATAGQDTKSAHVTLKLFAKRSATERLVASFDIEPAALVAGEQVPQGWGAGIKGQTLEVENVDTGSKVVVAQAWTGRLVLSKAGPSKGDAIAGTFEIKWVESSGGGVGKGGKATAEGTFETTYGKTAAKDPFAAGSGTLKLAFDGKGVKFAKVGAEVHGGAKGGGTVELVVHGQPTKGDALVAHFGIPAAAFVVGKPISCEDHKGMWATIHGKDPKTPHAVLTQCEVVLHTAGTAAGDPVKGTFSGRSVGAKK